MTLIILTTICAIGLGIFAERKFSFASPRLARKLALAMIYAIVPFYTFFTLIDFTFTFNVGLGIVMSYLAIATVGITAWLATKYLLHLTRPEAGAVICASIQANTGYLGLPLIAILLGQQGLSDGIAYDQLVQAPTLLIGGFGIAAAFGGQGELHWKDRVKRFILRNPPLLAVIAAFIVPASWALPEFTAAAKIVIYISLPLGFFILGITLAQTSQRDSLRVPPQLTKPVAFIIGVRLLLAPALLAAITIWWLDIPTAYLVLAAMPCGINTLAIAYTFDLDLPIAASAIAWTTILVLVILSAATAAKAIGVF